MKSVVWFYMAIFDYLRDTVLIVMWNLTTLLLQFFVGRRDGSRACRASRVTQPLVLYLYIHAGPLIPQSRSISSHRLTLLFDNSPANVSQSKKNKKQVLLWPAILGRSHISDPSSTLLSCAFANPIIRLTVHSLPLPSAPSFAIRKF